MPKEFSKEGFTLIELSLSIVFIAVLSLSIVITILNTVSSYRRGLTLSQVNTLGMAIADDMRAAVQNASTRSPVADCSLIYADATMKATCENNNAEKFVYDKRAGNIRIGTQEEKNVPLFGTFCTGAYSYVWNSGYFGADNVSVLNVNKASVTYNYKGTKTTKNDFRLLKIRDDSRAICEQFFRTNYGANFSTFNGKFDVSSISIDEEPVELLDNKEGNDLAIYDISSTAPAASPDKANMFYSVSFILGTTRGGANIKANGKSCAAPQDSALSDFDYCAINKFNFAVQANGG